MTTTTRITPNAKLLTRATMLGAVLAAIVAIQPAHAAPAAKDVPVVQLPTVTVTAKRIPVVELERVVVVAKRPPATTVMAQRGAIVRQAAPV